MFENEYGVFPGSFLNYRQSHQMPIDGEVGILANLLKLHLRRFSTVDSPAAGRQFLFGYS